MTRVMTEEAYAAHQARVHAVPVDVAPQTTLLELREVSFMLAMPPSVNDAWHHIPKTGGKALTDEHRQFRTNTISRVRLAMGHRASFAGRIEMTARLTFTNRQRRDIDNRVKPLLDALTHAKAWYDDSQVDALHVFRILGDAEQCEVTLKEIAA